MSSIRSSLLAAAACASLVPFTACGGGSGDDKPDAPANATPEGTHYSYVVSKAYVPSKDAEAMMWGLDIGAMKTSKPDGLTDNQLGLVFSFLSGQGLSVSDTINTSVDQGKILLLLDYQTSDFTTATTSGLTVKLGGVATPPACAGAADTVCRHHLDGNASFTIAANSPTNSAVTGPVAGGTFTGGPGDFTLQLAVGSTDPITLNLHNARAKAVAGSPTGISVVLGGALLVTDLNGTIIPAIFTTLTGILETACPRPRDPAKNCSCTGSAVLIMNLLDMNPHDCEVTLPEVAENNLLKVLLNPDVCNTATCDKPDALSVGIKFDAVKASF